MKTKKKNKLKAPKVKQMLYFLGIRKEDKVVKAVKERHICKMCSRVFRMNRNLNRHMEEHVIQRLQKIYYDKPNNRQLDNCEVVYLDCDKESEELLIVGLKNSTVELRPPSNDGPRMTNGKGCMLNIAVKDMNLQKSQVCMEERKACKTLGKGCKLTITGKDVRLENLL